MARTAQVSTAGGAAGTAARTPVVLQVVPHMGAGGVARGTVEVAAAIVRTGWRALVASAGGPGVAALEAAGARHVALPLDTKNPLRIWRNAASLEAVIRDSGADIVHARSRAPAWSAALAARSAGAHFVTTFHGTYGDGSIVKRRYNAIMISGEVVIAISDHIARHMRVVYDADCNRIRVIHRGVDVHRFDPAAVAPERVQALRAAWDVTGGEPVVMLPGRLTGWKGQAVMVEAMAQLAHRGAVCLLVGDDQGRGRYRAALEAQIAGLGLGRRVRLVGATDDMPAAYLVADLVVSASTEPEAFGRVAVEAQAMARPVIATAHGGALETVAEGLTGWLVTPGNARALAVAVDRALALEPELRADYGRSGRARVSRMFTTEAMCDKTLAVYRGVLTGADADRGR